MPNEESILEHIGGTCGAHACVLNEKLKPKGEPHLEQVGDTFPSNYFQDWIITCGSYVC